MALKRTKKEGERSRCEIMAITSRHHFIGKREWMTASYKSEMSGSLSVRGTHWIRPLKDH